MSAGLKGGWERVPFEAAFTDVTSGNPKLQTREYRPRGKLPIIDQGQEFIAGYTNEERACFRGTLPVILFGDHTRVFKYIDFPFVLGADGVKALAVSPDFFPKFAYHYLQAQQIPESGYSRHFKFLKEIDVVRPPPPEQRRIAAILDKADAIRRKQQQALTLADEFLRSVFLEMFGDPMTNPKGWGGRFLSELGVISGGLQVTASRKSHPIDVPYLRVANVYRDRLDLAEVKTIRVTASELERTRLQTGDVLIVEGHGNADEIGRTAVWDGSIPDCVHQNHLIRFRANRQEIAPNFLSYLLNSRGGRRQLIRSGKTTSGLNTISTSDVKRVELPCPPIEMQLRFVSVIDAVHRMRIQIADQLSNGDVAFASLSQRAFCGVL